MAWHPTIEIDGREVIQTKGPNCFCRNDNFGTVNRSCNLVSSTLAGESAFCEPWIDRGNCRDLRRSSTSRNSSGNTAEDRSANLISPCKGSKAGFDSVDCGLGDGKNFVCDNALASECLGDAGEVSKHLARSTKFHVAQLLFLLLKFFPLRQFFVSCFIDDGLICGDKPFALQKLKLAPAI